MADKDALLPCGCGGKPTLYTKGWAYGGTEKTEVYCGTCGIKVTAKTETEASAKWNRALSSPPAAARAGAPREPFGLIGSLTSWSLGLRLEPHTEELRKLLADAANALRACYPRDAAAPEAPLPGQSACEACGGTGQIMPAHDMLARSPKEQAEYLASIHPVRCWKCHGSGKAKGDAMELAVLSGAAETLHTLLRGETEAAMEMAGETVEFLDRLIALRASAQPTPLCECKGQMHAINGVCQKCGGSIERGKSE